MWWEWLWKTPPHMLSSETRKRTYHFQLSLISCHHYHHMGRRLLGREETDMLSALCLIPLLPLHWRRLCASCISVQVCKTWSSIVSQFTIQRVQQSYPPGLGPSTSYYSSQCVFGFFPRILAEVFIVIPGKFVWAPDWDLSPLESLSIYSSCPRSCQKFIVWQELTHLQKFQSMNMWIYKMQKKRETVFILIDEMVFLLCSVSFVYWKVYTMVNVSSLTLNHFVLLRTSTYCMHLT